MLEEVLFFLKPSRGGVFVDCTIGEGGHARAILESGPEDTLLVGIDRDREILRVAERTLQPFAERIHLVHSNFSNVKEVLESLKLEGAAGVLFDLGVSLYHLSKPERGFSFRHEGPLDMRLDGEDETTAAHLVNNLKEAELKRILYEYGEERWAPRIARHIVRAREKGAIETTGQLAEIVRRAIPAKYRPRRIDPATRSFQALRIAVNGELDVLPGAIRDAIEILEPGGRACFISFHSLEDREVKRGLRSLERGCAGSLESTASTRRQGAERIINILTPKPLSPSPEERVANPASRSAKLRAAEKL